MRPFPLSAVKLLEGPFAESARVNLKVLDDIGPETALYAYRVQAKLPTKAAKPLTSWASPEPGGAFPGFYEGHYLSAISMAAAQSQDPKMLKQVEYMVAELGRCQKALGGDYLFASPEVEFDAKRLDGVAWYRMHKLMEGLVAAHHHTGNRQAVEILKGMARWIKTRTDIYTEKKQWEAVHRVEYGGMQEALANLYGITGDPEHKRLSRLFEEREKMLDQLVAKKDIGGHANTVIAKMAGAGRIAEIENDDYYRRACEYFWDSVAGEGERTYATGGTSIHEGLPGRKRLADSQSRMAQETCCSYNMLKVTQSLFHLSGDAKYIDYYERVLFNSILGSQDPESGWKTYYQPLVANTLKDYRSHLTGCYCCNGTGLENPTRYPQAIYSHRDDEIYVNLFIASKVEWKEKGVSLTQKTRFPEESSSSLSVSATKPTEFSIGIRVPAWCEKGFGISINGKKHEVTATPGTFAVLKRTWKDGDTIDVSLPMSFSKYPMPDRPSQLALMYGPVVLVGLGADPACGELIGDVEDPADWTNNLDKNVTPGDDTLTFTAKDSAGRKVSLVPFYKVGADTYFTGYWDIVDKLTPREKGNVALGKKTTTSNPVLIGVNLECFMRPGKAVDGQFGGQDDWYVKWFPNGMAPAWLTVDLGEPHKISKIRWHPAVEDFENKKNYRYKIEYSDDNQSWKTYADASKNKEVRKSYEHSKAATARYVKFSFLAQPEFEGNTGRPKLSEIQVYAAP